VEDIANSIYRFGNREQKLYGISSRTGEENIVIGPYRGAKAI